MGHKFYNNPGATQKFHEPYIHEGVPYQEHKYQAPPNKICAPLCTSHIYGQT